MLVVKPWNQRINGVGIVLHFITMGLVLSHNLAQRSKFSETSISGPSVEKTPTSYTHVYGKKENRKRERGWETDLNYSPDAVCGNLTSLFSLTVNYSLYNVYVTIVFLVWLFLHTVCAHTGERWKLFDEDIGPTGLWKHITYRYAETLGFSVCRGFCWHALGYCLWAKHRLLFCEVFFLLV